MKILVGLKRVIDYNVRVQVKPDGSGVVTDGVKMSINPFDEIALEEALRLREAGHAQEVIVMTIGPDAAQQQLRTGLAMGADRAILVSADEEIQPLTAARAMQKLIDQEQPELVVLGKQAIDDDCSQTVKCWPRCGTDLKPPSPPRLAWPMEKPPSLARWMPAWKPLRWIYRRSLPWTCALTSRDS